MRWVLSVTASPWLGLHDNAVCIWGFPRSMDKRSEDRGQYYGLTDALLSSGTVTWEDIGTGDAQSAAFSNATAGAGLWDCHVECDVWSSFTVVDGCMTTVWLFFLNIFEGELHSIVKKLFGRSKISFIVVVDDDDSGRRFRRGRWESSMISLLIQRNYCCWMFSETCPERSFISVIVARWRYNNRRYDDLKVTMPQRIKGSAGPWGGVTHCKVKEPHRWDDLTHAECHKC